MNYSVVRATIILLPLIVSSCSREISFEKVFQTSGTSAPVCSPFGDDGTSVAGGGLAGSLSYFTTLPSEARTTHLADFEDPKLVTKALSPVYFNSLNYPTRIFENGFIGSDGQAVKDNTGRVIIDYFSLNLSGKITLAGAAPGFYQFAILSDDGSRVSVAEDGTNYVFQAGDDIDHHSYIMCGTHGVNLQAGAELPIKVEYFQSRKNQIALIVLWRKITNQYNPPGDGGRFCGFNPQPPAPLGSIPNYNQWYFLTPASGPSAPTQNWLDYLAEGWSPIPAENFRLPSGVKPAC